MDILFLAQRSGELLDFAGVFIILIGAAYSSVVFIVNFLKNKDPQVLYKALRQSLGKSILLGLEFLVAGDIINSVAGTPSFTSVGVLAVIVLIRSFLSITFDMEIEGRWPWQKGKNTNL